MLFERGLISEGKNSERPHENWKIANTDRQSKGWAQTRERPQAALQVLPTIKIIDWTGSRASNTLAVK